MGQEYSNIINSIRKFYPVSDESIEELTGHFTPLVLPKKHLLIKGGVLNRHVYFIEKGFCRSYCILNGKEITIWFSREGDITFAMKDLYHNKPGYEYVEILEDSLFYSIPINELNALYHKNIEIANWSRVIHQECLLQIDQIHIDRLYLTAKERYIKLIEEQPDLLSRANLGHIASFLGMTQQNLSRLRNEMLHTSPRF